MKNPLDACFTRNAWKVAILALALISLTGCPGLGADTHDGSSESSVVSTSSFLSQIDPRSTGKGTFRSWGETLTLSDDESFEYVLHSPWTRNLPNGWYDVDGESDADCSFVLQGSYQYYTQEVLDTGIYSNDLKFSVSQVRVLNSKQIPGQPDPNGVCDGAAQQIRNQGIIRLLVSSFAPDAIVTVGNYELSADQHFSIGSTDSLGVGDVSSRFFVRDGVTLDQTGQVLAGLSGHTWKQGYYWKYGALAYQELEFTFGSSSKEMLIVNHSCGMKYNIGIDQITNSGDTDLLAGKIKTASSFTPDPESPLPWDGGEPIGRCSRFQKFIQGIPAYGMTLDYTEKHPDGSIEVTLGNAPGNPDPVTDWAFLAPAVLTLANHDANY